MLLAANPADHGGGRLHGSGVGGEGRGGEGRGGEGRGGAGTIPSVSRNITDTLAPFDLVSSTGYKAVQDGEWMDASVGVCGCVCGWCTLPHIQTPIVLGCTEGPIPNPFCFPIS